MKSLSEYITDATDKHYAIGHFNVATLNMLYGVIDGVKIVAKETGKELPILIGASEGERDFMGISVIVSAIRELRSSGLPIFLNADHTYSVERVKEAIDAGFDSAIFDGAKLSHEENVAKTKECVEYAKSKGTGVLIEAELGYIGEGSNIKESVPDNAGIVTNPEDAKKFVQDTGVNLLAPSVGNIHGIVKGGNPHIDPDVVREVAQSSGVPLVLHGGSGITEEDFVSGIKAGISVIHVSTELRVAYKHAIKKSLQDSEELAPYKYLRPARNAVADVVASKTKLFISGT